MACEERNRKPVRTFLEIKNVDDESSHGVGVVDAIARATSDVPVARACRSVCAEPEVACSDVVVPYRYRVLTCWNCLVAGTCAARLRLRAGLARRCALAGPA